MMNLLHRSAKRLLLPHSLSLPVLAEIPLHAFLHRYLLRDEPVQKNITEHCARHFSVVVEDHIHESSLEDQQQGYLATYVASYLPLSQHIHTGVTEERRCKGECSEYSPLQLSGGATILKSVMHVDDCAHRLVDDSVSTCTSTPQKEDEKGLNAVVCEAKTALLVNHKERNCCNVGGSEFVVANAGAIPSKSHKQGNQIDGTALELAEANFLLKHTKGNKYFDCSASEVATFDPCEATCEDINKEKGLDSILWGHAWETALTAKRLNKGKQGCVVDDTSNVFVCDFKSMSQKHNASSIREEMSKVSLDNTETHLQGEHMRMPKVQITSEVCKKDVKISSCNENTEGIGTCSDFPGSLEGVGASEKVGPFRKEQVLISQPHKRQDFAVLETKKNKDKKRRKKKKSNRQFAPEDPKHLHIATSGQGLSEEKLKTNGNSSKDAFMSEVQSRSISAVAHRECLEDLSSNNAMSREALKLKDKEKGKSRDAISADQREVNGGIRNGSVEDKHKLFIFGNSSKSSLHQDQTLGEISKHMESGEQFEEGRGEVWKNRSWEVELGKCLDSEYNRGKMWRPWEKGLLSRQEDAHRPHFLVKNEQADFNALSHNEAIDEGSLSKGHLPGKWQSVDFPVKPHTYEENEAESEAGDYMLENKGNVIDYKQLKDATSLDPPSNFWEQIKTVAPVQTIECAMERAKWDFAGLGKAHYPLKNHRELYIILDLNGVLIKRWDKNPSLPGVFKLNKKWIQLRPGCIEFLHKAFSSFKVGIWSTMTQRNVLSTCNYLEQQAHGSLPFFMLWSKDSCYQHRGIGRPNKANVVADFKPLSRVWGYFRPYLGFHNTVLVDDSPYKACMNNPYNCIFPDAFEGQTDDAYLNDVLWPYLENMRRSHNIQAYVADNPHGQLPVGLGHELYFHVQQVMDVFDYRGSLLRTA